jgi:hypothetical protein
MPEFQISALFRIRRRFLRSAHLERDFADPMALEGYVLTAQARTYLERLALGLRETSGQRAWRITGDYGSGKSSFALFLAHMLGSRVGKLPAKLRQSIDFQRLGVVHPRLLPVLATGSSEPMGVALLRALARELKLLCNRGRIPRVVERIESQLNPQPVAESSDQTVIRLVLEANSFVRGTRRASGILIVLDELGKFLEFGALHPERQDVYLLQALAEAASRSGKAPVFVVGLLHQGFQAYADQLSQAAQKEWEKVAGRFDELLFNQPLDDTATLIADALNIRTNRIPTALRSRARKDMAAVVDLGWYGAGAARNHLLEIAHLLYPLHPSVIPVLARLFSRFGQNERSLFSFLLSSEPFGLQEFANRCVSSKHFYRIHNLYDYARYTFGYRLGLQSFRSHWSHIESIVESFPAERRSEVEVLKTVGLLNVLDSSALIASEEAVRVCFVGDEGTGDSIRTATRGLKSKHVLYNRGVAGGLCLWPHTSANLEKAYEDASRALGHTPERVWPFIQLYLDRRPIVARRHYIETGNLRHFEVRFCPVDQLINQSVVDFSSSDGLILVALCETTEEREEALRIVESDDRKSNAPSAILYGIPHPLRALGKLVQEVRRWEWVGANTPELNNDSFAAEEVARQAASARQALAERVHCFVGLHDFGSSELGWYRNGKQISLANAREFHAYLSTLCDEIYSGAPRVSNELINRRALSSAAAAARTRLIEEIFTRSREPYLGMDPAKKPPEMSIYLSLLKGSGIHRRLADGWGFAMPSRANDPCNVRPALENIHAILNRVSMQKIRVSAILKELRMPPFGIRNGLSPVLLAAFAVMNQHHVAFYQNDVFMREMRGLDLVMLTKMPETFEIQFCKLAGVRSELFERLIKVLELRPNETGRPDVLDVVRPLCVFAAGLPSFSLKTKTLSAQALAVRNALLSAREPARLLFRELPEALEFPEFGPERPRNSPSIENFVQALKESLEELRMNYPTLLDRMRMALHEAFDLADSGCEDRLKLAKRSRAVLLAVAEPRLRAFCNRLVDRDLADVEWIESVGSLVTGVPPVRWADSDLERFHMELGNLCGRLRRVESLAFAIQGGRPNDSAVRVVITRADGAEVDRVVHFKAEGDDAAVRVESQISAILRDAKSAGFAGALRAFWKALEEKAGPNA